MKKRMPGALSLIGLTGAYLALRYPLLFLHNMKDWPLILFAAGVIVIAASGLAFGRKILPILTVAGYIAGFIAGYVFQFDYGIGLNSLWIIWTCVDLGAILAGIAAEILCGRRKLN